MAILVSLLFFVIGSIYDLKTREVSDKIWVAYGIAGLANTLIRFLMEPSIILLSVISIAITTALSLGLFYFGLFGGADSKAMICLGLTIPTPPIILQPIVGFAHPVFPLVVVILGFVCSASVAVWFGIRNLAAYFMSGTKMLEGLEQEPRSKKVLAFFTGYPADQLKLQSEFYLYPIEEIVEDPSGPRRSLKLLFSAEADREKLLSDFNKGLTSLDYHGKVWVTPGLPLLVFILAGLIIALTVGDPIFGGIILLATR